MDNIIAALLVGVFMPPIISLYKNPAWPMWARVALALGVSLIVGAGTAVGDGTLDLHGLDEPEGLLGAAGAAFTAATVVYKTWFQSTALNERLENVSVLPG